MKKKEKIVIVVLLIVLAIMIGIKIWYDHICQYSKETMIVLLQKADSYHNYYYEFKSATDMMGESYIIKVKDNKQIESWGDESFKWVDLEQKKEMYFENNNNKALIGGFGIIKYENVLTEPLRKYFLDDTYNYQFLRKEKYKNQNCYVIQMKLKDENGLNNSEEATIWINEETGIVLKIDHSRMESGVHKNIELDSGEYTVILNIITDEDVKEPDLTGYTIYER